MKFTRKTKMYETYLPDRFSSDNYPPKYMVVQYLGQKTIKEWLAKAEDWGDHSGMLGYWFTVKMDDSGCCIVKDVFSALETIPEHWNTTFSKKVWLP